MTVFLTESHHECMVAFGVRAVQRTRAVRVTAASAADSSRNVFNGVEPDTPAGWQRIERAIEELFGWDTEISDRSLDGCTNPFLI